VGKTLVMSIEANSRQPLPAEFLGVLADRVIADQGSQDAEARDRTDGGGVSIDTTGRSPGESAGLIAGVLRWFP